MIKVLHVTAALWENIGGPSESVPKLCRELLKYEDLELTLITLEGNLSESVISAQNFGLEVLTLGTFSKRNIWFTPSYIKYLPKIIEHADIVHVHGLWLHPMWEACRLSIKNNKKLIITPRGSLEPVRLKKSSWKKKIVAPFFDNKYLKKADCIHVTAFSEYKGIRSYELKNPVAIIPNGVDIPSQELIKAIDLKKIGVNLESKKRICLFMSRINPTKGILNLLKAWKVIYHEFQAWHLIIAGPDEREYSKTIRNYISQNKLNSSVSMIDPVYGNQRFSLMSEAELFVLPTTNENFGIVIAESLSCGTPVITTHGAPWDEIEQHNCGWWIPFGENQLIKALKSGMSLSHNDLKSMGQNGKILVIKNYNWDEIGLKMYDLYSSLMNNSIQRLDYVKKN